MGSSSRTSGEKCAICLDSFDSQPNCAEEEKRQLDCSHIFHRECIGEWLKRKHNCPLCRAHVEVNTPEAPRSEMTLREIMSVVRETVREIRRVRRISLDEDTPLANTARKVNSVAMRSFGFGD